MNIHTVKDQSHPALFQNLIQPVPSFFINSISSKPDRIVGTTAMQFKNAIFTIGLLVSACIAAAVPEAQPRKLT